MENSNILVTLSPNSANISCNLSPQSGEISAAITESAGDTFVVLPRSHTSFEEPQNAPTGDFWYQLI